MILATRLCRLLAFLVMLACVGPLAASASENTAFALPMKDKAVQTFLQDKRLRCSRDANYYKLSQAMVQPKILNTMMMPSEKKPWSFYKKLFITAERIHGGIAYMRDHRRSLEAMYARYHVPRAIVTAIIGIETSYGTRMGGHRLLDSLSTLAFYYPRRARYFQSELVDYLNVSCALSREHTEMLGSYAGAAGIPQFMPSSRARYAVSLHNSTPNLFTSHADAITSVGNYLFLKGKWRQGEPVVRMLSLQQRQSLPLHMREDTETMHALDKSTCKRMHCPVQAHAVWCPELGGSCYWLYPNFSSIMAYNISKNYALSVALLARSIQ